MARTGWAEEHNHQDAIRMSVMRGRSQGLGLDWGPFPPLSESPSEDCGSDQESVQQRLWYEVERLVRTVFASGDESSERVFGALTGDFLLNFQSLLTAVCLVSKGGPAGRPKSGSDRLIQLAQDFGGNAWAESLSDSLQLARRAHDVAMRLRSSGREQEVDEDDWGRHVVGSILCAFFLAAFFMVTAKRLELSPHLNELVRSQVFVNAEDSYVYIRKAERALRVAASDSDDGRGAFLSDVDRELEQEASMEAERILQATEAEHA